MFERLKQVRPAVWIGLAIGAATLVIAYLAYKNQSSVATTTTDPNAVTNTPGSLNYPPSQDNGLSQLVQAISDQWAQLLATLPTNGASGSGSGGSIIPGSRFLGPPVKKPPVIPFFPTGGGPVTAGTGTQPALPGIAASEATHAHLLDVPTHSDLIRAGVL